MQICQMQLSILSDYTNESVVILKKLFDKLHKLYHFDLHVKRHLHLTQTMKYHYIVQ